MSGTIRPVLLLSSRQCIPTEYTRGQTRGRRREFVYFLTAGTANLLSATDRRSILSGEFEIGEVVGDLEGS